MAGPSGRQGRAGAARAKLRGSVPEFRGKVSRAGSRSICRAQLDGHSPRRAKARAPRDRATVAAPTGSAIVVVATADSREQLRPHIPARGGSCRRYTRSVASGKRSDGMPGRARIDY